jgi:hypothetical protein
LFFLVGRKTALPRMQSSPSPVRERIVGETLLGQRD